MDRQPEERRIIVEVRDSKYYIKGIFNVFGTMFLETIVHFVILILIKGLYYNWDGLFTFYKNTGTYLIEDLIYNSLSILGLRLVFCEFVFRILIQLSSLRLQFKLAIMFLLSCFYMLCLGTLFFGKGFQWSDFSSLYFGWYFHLPLAVIIVVLIRQILFTFKQKKLF